ncbi:MAG: PQQ-dependent sugar dehydrogenase [Pseudohongiellaceae bacterium]
MARSRFSGQGRAILAGLCLAGATLVQAQAEGSALGAGPWQYDTFEQDSLQVSVLARGLDHPFGLVFIPGTQAPDNPLGDVLINERTGKVRLYRNGALQDAAVADLSSVFPLQQLFDIELHPRFADNGLVYFTFIKQQPHPDGSDKLWATTALARGRWNGSSLEAFEEIFEGKAWSDNICGASSRLHFLADGMLLFGISHRCDLEGPQRLDTHIGKVLRLHDDGSVPADNPFVAQAGALPEIYTWGNRSVMDFFTHPVTGAIWELENGAQGGDEINILQPGANYGWPLATYGRDYDGKRFGPQPWVEGTLLPELAWVPSITVSSLAFYTADKFPRWKDNLFVTGMIMGRMPGTGQLQRVVFNDKGEVRREALLEDLHQRIRYVVQGPDGLLYLLTDHTDGTLLRLAPADPALAGTTAPAPADAVTAPELLSFEGQDCVACHRSEVRLVGPSWLEIARRYERSAANLDLLAERIRAGSYGVWGEAPMAPHADLSVEVARDMVSRILALDE